MFKKDAKKPHIIVVGDLMLDHYLWGSCERISPEAPVQVVAVNKETVVLGGAGNVLNNLHTLEAQTTVLSVIGDDDIAKELQAHLEAIEVDCKGLIIEKGRQSAKKSRIIASNQQIVRYDKESTHEISKESQASLIARFEALIDSADMVILSDYGKGVLTFEVCQSIMKAAKAKQKALIVDPKGRDYSKYRGASYITPNKKEASEATGLKLDTLQSIEEAGFKLKKELDLEAALITLSEDGIAIFDESMRIHPTVAQEVFDVTGAGDTVIASIAYVLSLGFSIDEAVEFANAAAAVVVAKLGSATASKPEIEAYLSSQGHHNSYEHIKTFDEIAELVNRLRDKKIVFTNGCFDILHAGHVSYLEKAKSFGDVLIVGLNADSSVRKLKGTNRPINSEQDRAYLLAALHVVDYVVIFPQETPYELIKIIKPDVLVKGGDYEGKEVVGSDIAKEVKLVDFVAGKSTTNTITKIKEQSLC